MNAQEWFDDWDPQALYQKLVDKEVYDCVEGSPIANDGIVCGPVLRLINVDYERLMYNGSILMVLKNWEGKEPPKINFMSGPAPNDTMTEFDANLLEKSHFQPTLFHTDNLEKDTFQFYRYMIHIPLTDYEQMIKYSVNDESTSYYRFFIPSKERNYNVITYTCAGFSLAVDTTKFKGTLWLDVLRRHAKVHYNVMCGGGDQIYSDQIRLYSKKVAEWLDTKNKIKKYTMKVDDEFKKDLDNFYLKEYTEWYGYGHWHGSTDKSKTTQKCLPIALATIPSVNIWDDHDIIDGFGSYNDAFMKTEVFTNIGKAAYKYYMLFQHHVSMEEKEAYLESPHWILGCSPGAFIGEKSHSTYSRLGPDMALLGLDCRTERRLHEIVTQGTYNLVFDRLEKEIHNGPKKLEHLLIMIGVPVAYPRLVWLEWMFTSSLLSPIKYLSKKGIIARGLLNDFNGDVELLDDLNDHWCSRYHKAERNFLISKLQDFGAKHGVRVTILSGDVHLASLGRFKAKENTLKGSNTGPEYDPRLIFNIISSAIVNTPPPDAMAKLLQKRAGTHHFDHGTDEDSVPLFKVDTDAKTERSENGFLNKRNWSDIISVQNVMENRYLRESMGIKLNDKIVPGIVNVDDSAKELEKSKTNSREQAYPVTEKGVITSYHIETNTENSDGRTTWYVLPIPDLQIQDETLSHEGLKHAGEAFAEAISPEV